MIEIGFLTAKAPAADGGERSAAGGARQCPKCGGLSLVHQEGCDLCTACEYSRCG
jgi:ribonucleoside-diphosphate reductase alpha chain